MWHSGRKRTPCPWSVTHLLKAIDRKSTFWLLSLRLCNKLQFVVTFVTMTKLFLTTTLNWRKNILSFYFDGFEKRHYSLQESKSSLFPKWRWIEIFHRFRYKFALYIRLTSGLYIFCSYFSYLVREIKQTFVLELETKI